MRKNLILATALLFACAHVCAQDAVTTDVEKALKDEATSYIFSESQLDEDADATQDVIQINSSANVYTSNVGYLFSPMRFKYRALDQKYNEIHLNGVLANSAENGRFTFSTIGGMNDATRGVDSASPFETNNFGMAATGGSNNYNFRAGSYAAGHKVTLTGLNRDYNFRAMYTFGTGVTQNGWAFFGTVGCRWGTYNMASVEGTFNHSLAYFLSLQKKWDRHSLNIATWGSPRVRAQQGASTDEAYWLANDYRYNPYWGYQEGQIRNSRITKGYEPSALITWDFDINDNLKLTTSFYTKYAMNSGTRLQYNNAQNPKPDYWKNFPSYNYDVWDLVEDTSNDNYEAWKESYDYWTADKANRQIQWDKLYYANTQMNAVKGDAAYFLLARHNDHLAFSLGSTINWTIDKYQKLQGGLQLASNTGMHYQTVSDMMGAEYLHNVNNYAVGTYAGSDSRVQYDLRNPNGLVGEGDRYGYDFNIVVQKATAWTQYTLDRGITHSFISAKIGGTQMWRDGKMQNGLFANNSYGKSGTARFLDGGVKAGTNINLGKGHVIGLGIGYMTYAPSAYSNYGGSAFQAAEMNNNYIDGLKVEHMLTAEVGYAVNLSWLHANLTAYYNRGRHMNEWQNYYYDDVNSFTYVSMTDVKKDYYGIELGARFKVTSQFSIDLIGSMAEAKYVDDTDVSYLLSTQGTVTTDRLYNKGMREASTPLTVGSIGLNYNVKGWWLSLKGNYYDRIYLSYSPSLRYQSTIQRQLGAGVPIHRSDVPEQTKGNGGFMLDGSIGRQFRINGKPLSVNLFLTNILNNRKMVSGGYEQSRSSYTTDQATGEVSGQRTYNFQKNPMKYYVQGFNFMLNINYRF